ncbi:hypothetical protein AgCh_023483 [Apium graveolens]
MPKNEYLRMAKNEYPRRANTNTKKSTMKSTENNLIKSLMMINVQIINDRETGRSRGFGFVTFKDETSMRDVIEGIISQELDDGVRREGGGGGYGGLGEGGGGGYEGGGGGYGGRREGGDGGYGGG